MGVARELRDGGTLGREGGAWRREGGSGSTMERERERSLGRDGSLGRHCDLRGAELVQVAERQLSQIQHVHGYVTHTHITPAQVTCSGFFLCGFGSPSVCIQTHTRDVHISLTLPVCSHRCLAALETYTHIRLRAKQVCGHCSQCVCQSTSKQLC